MIEERVERFQCCPEFHPYLIEVFRRLPEEVLHEEILADPRMEIASIAPESHGRCFSLPSPVEYFIVLNETMLTQPKTEIIHTIVHELAHKAVNGQGTGLREKDAEELVRKWGFEEESHAVRYMPALLEMEGYRMGYEWAARQAQLPEFEDFYREWTSGAFSRERFDQFTELVKAKPISVEIGPLELSPEELIIQEILDSPHLKMALGFGIMTFIDESRRQSAAEETEDCGQKKPVAVYGQCQWCGRDIRYGNACLTICRNIEQVDWNAELRGDECTMIDSQVMLTLCASCANCLDHTELTTALAGRHFTVPGRKSSEQHEDISNLPAASSHLPGK